MPTYNIRNKKTGSIKQIFMTISEMEEYEKRFPGQEVLPGMPIIATHGVMGLKQTQTDSGFRDRVKEIAKRSPGHTMGKKYETKF